MLNENLRLWATVAGFVMIFAATALAFRQSLTWQHVILFCLGGVLAGISGVQITAPDLNVTIGLLADASVKTNAAANQQVEALASLGGRVDQLQSAVEVLQKSQSPTAAQAKVSEILAPSVQSRATFRQLLDNSKTLSLSAAEASRRISATAP